MPLVISSVEPTYDDARRMVGVWIRAPGAIGLVNGIRVFITLEALWVLEPSQVRDAYAAAGSSKETWAGSHSPRAASLMIADLKKVNSTKASPSSR